MIMPRVVRCAQGRAVALLLLCWVKKLIIFAVYWTYVFGFHLWKSIEISRWSSVAYTMPIDFPLPLLHEACSDLFPRYALPSHPAHS